MTVKQKIINLLSQHISPLEANDKANLILDEFYLTGKRDFIVYTDKDRLNAIRINLKGIKK